MARSNDSNIQIIIISFFLILIIFFLKLIKVAVYLISSKDINILDKARENEPILKKYVDFIVNFEKKIATFFLFFF